MAEPSPIFTEVVARNLVLASEEMAATLIALAFSPNIKERWDCSSAIFDSIGNVVAQANRVPLHLGSMIGAVEAIKAKYATDEISPGDMFLANDPFSGGGTHLPDLNIIAPVFSNGRVVAFVANIAHHADVGGMVPGSESALCSSIYQEGLRLPIVRLMKADVLQTDILDIIKLNSRTPDERLGDLQAQIAANRVGISRVAALFRQYEEGEIVEAIQSFLATSERRLSRLVQTLPAGVYRSEELLDTEDGGVVALRLALTVSGDRFTFDFSETDPQLTTSSRNVPLKAVQATVYAVVKSMMDPDVPASSGFYRAIDVVARPGSILNPVAPAAVGTRAITCGVIGDLIVAALTQVLKQGGMACSGPHHLVIFAGHDPKRNGYFVNYETIAGGMGASGRFDGLDAVRVHASGAANLPIEALENAYPIRVEQYALREESGGAGVKVGGRGLLRDYRILADTTTVSLSSERQVRPALGVFGGGAGATGSFLLNPGSSDERRLPPAANDMPLRSGDLLRVLTPGGGGFGSDR